jgi:hypothetical protein
MPLAEITPAQKIENARVMYGTWSKQHKLAILRWGYGS